MRAVLFITLLLSSSTALAAAQVIVGVADVDGDTTTLLSIPLSKRGEARPVGTLLHPRGDTPIGILVDDDRLAVVMPAHGDLVLKHLKTGEEHTLATGLMRNQRPQLLTTPRGPSLVAVRADGGAFDVVGIAPIDASAGVDVLTSVTTGWLGIVPVATSSTLSTSTALVSFDAPTARGVAQLKRLDGDGHLVDGVTLGTGIFRGGVVRTDGTLLIEQERNEGVGQRRSSVVAVAANARDLAGAKTVTTGLAGLSPVVAGARAAVSTGSKDGSVLVDGDGRGFVRWPGARVGQARPQAMSAGGDVVVVVLVARGQQLPAELWALTKQGGRLLLAPEPGRVVTVYGVSGAGR